MLIRFVVSNFLSFNEETEFNMLAGNFKTHKHHVYKAKSVEVLKSAAIYGPNGAGKSNLIKAMDTLKKVVLEGKISKSIDEQKFKLDDNREKPIFFEIELSIEHKIYAYGLTINHGSVIEEWLYESGITKKDKLIFERKSSEHGKISIKLSPAHQKTQKQKLLIELIVENLLKPNELFIGQYDHLKIDEITEIFNWFAEKLFIIYPQTKYLGFSKIFDENHPFQNFTNNLLAAFDIGIKKLDLETVDFDTFFNTTDKQKILDRLENEERFTYPSRFGNVSVTKENDQPVVKKIVAIHEDVNGDRVIFDLAEESDGTRRILDFIPICGYISNDTTFIVDEIDQSLHPTLLQMLVKKIMADDTTKGQLIFTTHESNLLDMSIFRQDEIWFVEKDKHTISTQLYSLSDYKPRYDLDIRKGYLKGRFGAIPFLAHLEDLNWN